MINIIICVFLVIVGIVVSAAPEKVYDTMERWKSSGDAEPSKQFIILTRLYGVILIVTGIVVPVILLI